MNYYIEILSLMNGYKSIYIIICQAFIVYKHILFNLNDV